jgi:hypothetical protein
MPVAGGRRPLLGDSTGQPTETPPFRPAPAPPVRVGRVGTARSAGRRAPRDDSGRGPVVVGTLTGEVACEPVAALGAGRRLLVQAVAVVAVVALLVAVVVERGLPGALVLFACGMPLLLQVLVHVLRPSASVDHAPPGDRERTTEQWVFQVVEPSGRVTNCVLTGGMVAGPLKRGDVVEVYGRTDRTDEVRVREVVVVADQRPVRGRPDPGFVLTRVADVVTVVLAAVGLVGAVMTLVVR